MHVKNLKPIEFKIWRTQEKTQNLFQAEDYKLDIAVGSGLGMKGKDVT